MEIRYAHLKGRIVEKYGTQLAFAKALGVSQQTVSYKMQGKKGFTQRDIIRWSELLGIDQSEYGQYFFT